MKKLLSLALVTAVAAAHGATLFDNGAFQTGTGNGVGGANTSLLSTPDTTLGFGAQVTASNVVADNFSLASASSLTSLTVYSYQTGATTASINGGVFAIYSAAPTSLTSTPIAGSLTSNVVATSTLTSVYRVTSTTLTDATRRIQAVTFNLSGINLAAGNYYVAWSMTGTGTSGPWAIPVTPAVAGANGLQYTTAAGTFASAIDTGSSTVKDFAFNIQGTASAVPEPATMAALGLGVVALVKRRRKQA